MTGAVQHIWSSTVTIGGIEIPVMEWSTEVGCFGQIGHARIKTGLIALSVRGISLPDDFATQVYTPLTIALNGSQVFSGAYQHGFFVLEEDEAELWARDWSAPLFDTQRSLADLQPGGGGYTGQTLTVTQLVTNIISFVNNLYPTLGLSVRFGTAGPGGTGQGLNNNPSIGTILDQGVWMSATKKPLWDYIIYCARACGARVTMTPDRVLIFSDQPNSGQVRNYSWMQPPNVASTATPAMKCEILHQPQRNKMFTVIVQSFHGPRVAVYTATVTVLGEDVALPGGHTAKAGTYKGVGGANIRSALSSRGLGVPIIIIRAPGLDQAACQARAESIAADISQKLFCYTLVVDGDPSVMPFDQIILDEGTVGALYGFKGRPLNVTGVNSRFVMPQGEGISEDGYLTIIKALAIPPNTASDANVNSLASLFGG